MIPTSWGSYPSIFNLGHRALADLGSVPVNVEEKIDGSQFSFCKTNEGELLCRSKGVEINIDAPEKMFSKACETVKEIEPLLVEGYTYRCEYLQKPKHNTLAYNRVPAKNLIVFDIQTGNQEFLEACCRATYAHKVGLEVVPVLGSRFTGEDLNKYLDCTSCLGGTRIEGVVIKPQKYNLFGQDKKVLMGKYVSEVFKEKHNAEWKHGNPNSGDILEKLAITFKTEARWQKAVQHLREAGQITDSPKDIGLLIKEVPADLEKECREEILQILWQWAWPSLRRRVVAGLPEFYKVQLLAKQFEEQPNEKML